MFQHTAITSTRIAAASLRGPTATRSLANTITGTRAYSSKRGSVPHPNTVPLAKALSILKAYEVGCPDRTVEIHVKCAPEKGHPPIRGSLLFTRTFKSNVKILVFAEGEKAKEARAAGADIVGGAELVPKVGEGSIKFDKCLSTPDMLPKVAKIARILGPKGLMPTVNKGTVSADIAEIVKFSKNAQDYRADKENIVHSGVGKIGFTDEEITKNITTLLESIRAQARGNKAKFVDRVYLSSTNGPGVQVSDA